MRHLLVTLSLVAFGVAAADTPSPTTTTTTLYKSVGPDGRIVYGDRPPVDGRSAKTMTFENLPSSPLSASTLAYLEELRKGGGAAAPASVSRELVLFTTAWCGYCRKAKAYLASKGASFREVDIESKAGATAYAQAGGQGGVPYLVIAERHVRGFSVAAYEALLQGGKK